MISLKKILFVTAAMMSVLFITTACGAKTEKNEPVVSTDVSFEEDDYTKIIDANNALGFNVLNEVEPDENDNTFISPTSLLMALSMAYNGADGETKEEIATVLQVNGIEVEELNKANASLLTKFHKDSEQTQLQFANSIWLNNNYHFQDDFAKNNKDYFNAEIKEIDIADDESATKINEWVKSATNDKIDKIIEAPLNPDLVAVLINAIYFKGDWSYEFDEKLTESQPFQLPDGTTKEVPLMTLNEELAYIENDTFQAVQLPYSKGGMSMNVFLPTEESSLEEFKQLLTTENWESWRTEFNTTKGTVKLPKFQLEYETSLNDVLKNLGMTRAFGEGADFTKMIQEDAPLWFSEIKQKTFVVVDEEGTEAAAVTSGEIETTSAPMDEPFTMVVDRPFFFTIMEDETNTILFAGFIQNPQDIK